MMQTRSAGAIGIAVIGLTLAVHADTHAALVSGYRYAYGVAMAGVLVALLLAIVTLRSPTRPVVRVALRTRDAVVSPAPPAT